MTEPVDDPATSGFEIGTDGIGRLVVGFDGTDPSRDALAFASGLARRGGTWLVVAVVTSVGGLAGLSAAAVVAEEQAGRDLAEQLRVEVAKVLDSLGIRWEFVSLRGDVATELEALAEQRHADAVVVGRSSSRAHAIAGSVPARLLRHAHRPVVVVP
jgi:nucleotide-binding universal stress UspA family protein